MTYPRIYCLLICFLWLPELLTGQGDPLLRLEIETKSDEANYRIIPCNRQGALLYYKSTLAEDQYSFWIFVKYNVFLQEEWKKDIPVFQEMSYERYKLVGDHVYLFFYAREKKKESSLNFQVLKLDLTSGRYELFSGLFPENAYIAAFEVAGDHVLVGMNIANDLAGIYSFNMITKQVLIAHEYTENKAKIETIYTDTASRQVTVLFNIFNNKSDYYLELHTFDEGLTHLGNLKFYAESGKKFSSGKIVTVKGVSNLIFGTYSLLKGGTVSDKDYFVMDASGFYLINYSNPENFTSRYENFIDLENMTGYLVSREYQLAKKKAEKKDDPDAVSLGYNLILHDIIERDSLFYLIGEGYYEEYHTVTNTYYDFYGRAMPVSYSVFDGYRHFNAFVSCYDYNGNKTWDNGMEIFNILSFDLKKRVSVYFLKDELILAYNRDGKINYKIIRRRETVEGVGTSPLETSYVNDKIMTDTKSDMAFWYDNYFLAYGFQTIRNNSLTNSKRTVFYINKVRFE